MQPFLPENARLLMLGSFPPQRKRWCMDFYYPNFINDMWRIMGFLFYQDKNHFVDESRKSFKKQDIVDFLSEKGIALYDTATAVRRLQDNASDKYLEVVRPTDLQALLRRIPQCRAIVTTGQKATDTLCGTFRIHRDFWRLCVFFTRRIFSTATCGYPIWVSAGTGRRFCWISAIPARWTEPNCSGRPPEKRNESKN